MKPKNEIMTYPEMVAMNEEKRQSSRLYSKTDGDAQEKIAALVDRATAEVSSVNLSDKISLSDTPRVREIVVQYMEACQETGILPSKIGACRALGVTRVAVDDYMRRNPESSTAQFLAIAFDSFSELLTTAAMYGAAHPIVSIFISKAIYAYRDSLTIETPQSASPLGEILTPEAIASKYDSLPED